MILIKPPCPPPRPPHKTAQSMYKHVPAPPDQHAGWGQPEQPCPSAGVPLPCAVPPSSAPSSPQAGAPSAALQLQTPAELPSASEPPPCLVLAQPARQCPTAMTKLKQHSVSVHSTSTSVGNIMYSLSKQIRGRLHTICRSVSRCNVSLVGTHEAGCTTHEPAQAKSMHYSGGLVRDRLISACMSISNLTDHDIKHAHAVMF